MSDLAVIELCSSRTASHPRLLYGATARCRTAASRRKELREQSRPGGAKPGHEGHSRINAEDPGQIVDHRLSSSPDCGLALSPDLPADTVSVHEHIELPELKPLVDQHRHLAVVCLGWTMLPPSQ